MSREIKFRLVKDGKIVGYEKHTQNKGNFKSSIFHSPIDDNCVGYEWSNITHFTEKFIDCDIKEQYTGLKDRSGKEIYEGDIIHVYHESKNPHDKSINDKGVVIYQESNLRFIIKGTIRLHRMACLDTEYTIVGNIHESFRFNKENIMDGSVS